MPYRFDSTQDYFKSETRVAILIKFAKQEGVWGHDVNRNLFLKLGVVLIVTQFQVYVEKVLEEYHYELKQSKKLNRELPLFLRLKSLKIHIEQSQIHLSLNNPNNYNEAKLNDIKSFVEGLNNFCNDDNIIPSNMEIVKKYPLGKQGLNELKELFKQIEGKDIFENVKFDINKLSEILSRRHSIIHEDSNDQLTEVTVNNYKEFVAKVVKHIDNYLNSNLVRKA
jgi:hypothetical protein